MGIPVADTGCILYAPVEHLAYMVWACLLCYVTGATAESKEEHGSSIHS